VTAEIGEEVVVDADEVDPEDVFPDAGEDEFKRRGRGQM